MEKYDRFAYAHPGPFGTDSLTRIRMPLRGANWAKQITSRLRQDEFYIQTAQKQASLILGCLYIKRPPSRVVICFVFRGGFEPPTSCV